MKKFNELAINEPISSLAWFMKSVVREILQTELIKMKQEQEDVPNVEFI